jgi:hypothetical protein
MKLLLLASIAVAVIGGGLGLYAWAAGDSDEEAGLSPHTDFDLMTVGGFDEFSLYWVGPNFRGHALRVIDRVPYSARGTVEGEATAFVYFGYGDCEVRGGEGGCSLPLGIQTWRACDRNPAMYSLTPNGEPLPHEEMTLRGVPAFQFEAGTLEIYTADLTIVVYGNPDNRQKAVEDLQPANDLAGSTFGPDGSLPPPVPGAMEGELKC